jgi:hypothetical protein
MSVLVGTELAKAPVSEEVIMPRFLRVDSQCCFSLIILCSLCAAALATDRGDFANQPDQIRQWFKNAKAPNGGACCDQADGHRTEYELRENHYWVLIDGKWVVVPAQAVIHNEPNPIGEAVVWYKWSILGSTEHLRREPIINCFAAPAQG